MAYLLVFLKSLTNLTESVLIRKYTDKHSTGSMLFTGIISLFAMAFFLITDTDGFHPSAAILPYAAAFGALYCVAYLLTFTALACGPFTLSMLVISYCLVFPIVYGIVWLGESVTLLTCAGFLLLALSLYLVRGTKADDEHKITFKWVLAISVVCVGNGVLSILQKVQQLRFDNAQNHEFMVISLGLSAAILIVSGILRDRKDLKEIVRYGLPCAGLAGVSNGATNLLTLFVNNLMPLSIAAPLSSGVKMVLSYVCSGLLLKEHYGKRQIIGVGIGIAALICLNI